MGGLLIDWVDEQYPDELWGSKMREVSSINHLQSTRSCCVCCCSVAAIPPIICFLIVNQSINQSIFQRHRFHFDPSQERKWLFSIYMWRWLPIVDWQLTWSRDNISCNVSTEHWALSTEHWALSKTHDPFKFCKINNRILISIKLINHGLQLVLAHVHYFWNMSMHRVRADLLTSVL